MIFLLQIGLKFTLSYLSSFRDALQSLETIQPVMEWFFLSLFKAGYFGKAHLFWLQSQTDPALEKQARQLHRRGEPILGYRCGDRVSPAPSGFYWRMMPEHPSMRVYQLEVRRDD